MASFTLAVSPLQLCCTLLCVIFSALTLTSSLPTDQLKEAFEQKKKFWLENECIFPSVSDFQPNAFKLMSEEYFSLKACSSANEMPVDASFGRLLCFSLFNVSEIICRQELSSSEKENLRPDALAQLTDNENWDVCSDGAVVFAFLNDTEQCKSQCIENEKISPVCKLLVAAAVNYEEARYSAGEKSLHPHDNDRTLPPPEGKTTFSVSQGQDSTGRLPSLGHETQPPISIEGTHFSQKALPEIDSSTKPAGQKTSLSEANNTSQPATVRASLSENGQNASQQVGKQKTPLPQGKQTTAAPAEEQKTSPQGKQTTAAPAEQKTSPQGKQTTAAPVEQKTSPQGKQTTAAPVEEQKTSPQGKQTTAAPAEQKISPQGKQTTAASVEEQKTSPQGKQSTAAPTEEQKTSPQGKQTTAAPTEKQKTSPQGNQDTAVPVKDQKTSQQGTATTLPAPTGHKTTLHREDNNEHQPTKANIPPIDQLFELDTSTTVSFVSSSKGPLNIQKNTHLEGGDNIVDKAQQPPQPRTESPGVPHPQPTIPEDGEQAVSKLDLEEESHSSGKFMIYFITAVVVCVAAYVVYHNRQKIIAFILEGHRSDSQRRSPPSSSGSKVKYSKLKPSAEELLPSLDKPVSTTNYIY